jgi:glutamate racemase
MSAATDGGRPGAMRGAIAIFDSGIGGLPYLEPARAALPDESFVYLADRAGFPYGTKTREEVRDIVLGLVSRLVAAYDPKAIVIACNTASQAGLDAVRRANPGLPIIGTVPAIKPAAERTRSGTIGVMATAGAVEDPYLDALIARYAKGVTVIREAAQELVSFVERRAATAGPEERREAARPFVRRLVELGADEIVLACTHYLHLRDDIAELAGPGVEVVDSRAGVARRLKQVLTERGLLRSVAERGLLRSAERGLLRSVAERGLLRPAAEPVPAARGLFLLSGDAPFEAEYGLLAEAFGLAGPFALGDGAGPGR